MSEKKSARIRLLAVIDILQMYTNPSNVLSIEEICAHLEQYGFETTKRNVLADIKLINTTPYKIIYVTTPKKGYYTTRTFSISEADALLKAVESSQMLSAEERNTAKQALSRATGIPTNNLLMNTTERVSVDVPREAVTWEILMTLREAIQRQKRVTLDYKITCPGDSFGSEEPTEKITINPIKIAISSNSMLLIFTKIGSKKPECMHLCRIAEVEILNSEADKFSGDISESVGFFTGIQIKDRHERTDWVFLKFDTQYAELVKNFFDFPVQLRKSEDGKYLAKALTVIDEQFIGFLLCFGDKIELVAPLELRDYIKDRIKNNLYIES
ncbi:MAG: WYL domain-containing protein [Clostridia bacterium]|nr:WYL domain-containing protein [Clostridia bacterium]